jgi:hypothetical protein
VTVLRDMAALDSLKNRWRNRLRLKVDPRDTLVLIGQTVQLRAFLVDTTGLETPADVRWQLLGSRAGRIDADGLFTAERRGVVLARATKERYSAMARIMVALAARDTSDADADSVQVGFKDREGRAVGNIHRMGEKDVLKIAGLPFPLNVLNGGELVFPPGCLPENVSIQVTLPEGTETGADSVEFPGGILNGASFSVTVDGVPVSPYVFGFPVQVSFPLHAGLLEALGLTPDDLGVFFSGLGGTLDSTGVSNVVVDTALGMVYAEVEHFSDVVVAPKRGTTAVPGGGEALPSVSRLYANYPNPFNPDTRIRFDLSGSRNRNVTVKIYNVMGREIRTLWNGPCAPGSHTVTWDGRDERGLAMGSGVYLVRLEVQELRQTRRMVLLK